MAITKYPKFGADAGFIRTSYTNRSDQAELQLGRHTEVLVRSTTKECSATTSSCAWGLDPDTDGLGNITTILDAVRLSIEDEPDINYTAAQTYEVGPDPYIPSQVVTPDPIAVTKGINPDKPLLMAKCCIVKRARITLTVEGKGNPDWALGTPFFDESDEPIITVLKTAIGALDMMPIVERLKDDGAVFRLINFTVNDTDQDWQKFTSEFQCYIDADTSGASVALPYVLNSHCPVLTPNCTEIQKISVGNYDSVNPPSCSCPDIECCDSYRLEFSLNGNGYAEITATVTKNPRKIIS